ncbi:MAG: hypothetical protein ACE5JJ_06550 [Nitrospinota bacterium]
MEFRVPSDDLAAQLERIVSDLFRKAGYKVRSGRWDGDPQGLPKLDADYALWGRIEAFNATGTGTLYDTRREMVVRIAMKMGSKARGVVRTRVVEVTPKDRAVHFFGWWFDHYGAMAKFVNDALSLAVERAATELAGRAAKP